MKRKFMLIIVIIVAAVAIAAVAILCHPAFGRLPRGKRLARIEKSEHYRDGSFQNQHLTPALTGDKSFFQSAWNYLFNKPKDTTPHDAVPSVKTPLKSLNPDTALVVWLGHSSLYIQQDGKRILVDPVLTNVFPASLMLTPFKGTMIYSPDDIPDIDVLLITHDHWDHLDYATVNRLRSRVGTVVCPLGVGEHFEYWGYSPAQIVELDWYDTARVSDALKIRSLPSRHFSGRSLTRNKTLWCGYMIDGSRKIYISGDGGYDSHFKEIAKEYPEIDLAVMENGQYSEDWKYIHLLPADLQKAVSDISPKAVITVHNSKFSLAPHPWQEPMRLFYDFAEKENLNLITPVIGQQISDSACRSNPWWEKVR